MIPVARVQMPSAFHRRCRMPGRTWLRDHPGAKRPRDYWTQFKPILAVGFGERCGYAAMYEPVGSVDHFMSWDNHPELAYEWTNLRFVAEWINKSKQTADDAVLDPYEVKAGWFEITLPDLQLRVTDRVPPGKRARAEYTLTRLHLRDDERVLRQRRGWYAMYLDQKLTLDGLEQVAPLIAEAVRTQQAAAKSRAIKPTRAKSPEQPARRAATKRKPRRGAPRKRRLSS